MRKSLLSISATAVALGVLCAGAANADPRYRDQVHADSFGNLVVYAPGGYKRIVVGKGYLAEELAGYGRPDEPKVVYGDAGNSHGYRSDCRRYPVRAFGRSYMYGLPDHVVPVFESACQ